MCMRAVLYQVADLRICAWFVAKDMSCSADCQAWREDSADRFGDSVRAASFITLWK